MCSDLRLAEDPIKEQEILKSMDDELKRALATARCNICSGNSFIIKKSHLRDWSEPFSGNFILRENLICKSCASISRDRMLIWGLAKSLHQNKPLKDWKEDKTIHILETSGHRGHPFYLSEKFDYIIGTYIIC